MGRDEQQAEARYSYRLTELLSDDLFWSFVYDLIPSVSSYIEYVYLYPNLSIPSNNLEDFTKFAILILESVNFLVDVNKSALNVSYVDTAVNCVKIILRNRSLLGILARDTHVTWLCSAVNSIYKLLYYLLMGEVPLPDVPKYGLISTLDNEVLSAGHACYQLLVLVSWMEKSQNSIINIPIFLLGSIKSIIVSLSRLPHVNSYLLTPISAWRGGLSQQLFGTFKTQAPPLPIEFLQEVDILEEFIYRYFVQFKS